MTEGSEDGARAMVRRHLVAGWLLLLVFLALGLVLEAFHGFKVAWYVDTNNQTRRLMWTLAHAHGVLVGLVNLAFAATIAARPLSPGRRSVASTCLLLAGLLLPGGFLLGGIVIYQGDPGLGVFLTPVGGLLLLGGAALTLGGVARRSG